MFNLFDAIRHNPSYNRLEIGDFLFAEYTCGLSLRKVAAWTETDYLLHVVSGSKAWHTIDGVCEAKPGDTLFVRKGGSIVEQNFGADVCVLMVFIPDSVARTTVRELSNAGAIRNRCSLIAPCAMQVENDVGLSAFFQSVRTYLSGSERPSEALVKLKVKELIVSVVTSRRNALLAAYFNALGATDAPSMGEIMEANFRYNLSIEEYARLCHRSLSSFKREFQALFRESPGKWLQQKRLEYSAVLLRNSKMNVTEIAFESGFENVSNFSRAFKERFEMSPLIYRQGTAFSPLNRKAGPHSQKVEPLSKAA